jgi:hypothetical protein
MVVAGWQLQLLLPLLPFTSPSPSTIVCRWVGMPPRKRKIEADDNTSNKRAKSHDGDGDAEFSHVLVSIERWYVQLCLSLILSPLSLHLH